jgi:DNA polymerase/3'-5' exonuclease PolX
MKNCYNITVKEIKRSTQYKDLPKSYGKSKLKKKELCDAINKYYELKNEIHEIPKKSITKKSIKITDKKEQVLLQIGELRDLYKANGDTYRAKSYDNAFYAIKQLEKLPITKKDLLKIKGIGKSIADKIFESINTGKIQVLEQMKESQKQIAGLVGIDGIGPQFAKKLLSKNIDTLDKLRKAYKDGTIKLTEVQRLGITYYEDLHEKIPRKEIQQFEKKLKKIVKEVDPKLDFEIMGSYRRGLSKSGDIDLLLFHPDVKTKEDIQQDFVSQIVQKLSEKYKYIGKLAHGNKKFMGLFILQKRIRHIDILFVPMNNLYAAINYFTGSKTTNVKLREHAKKLGYTVNEFYIKSGNKIIYLKSEKDLYDILGLPYIKPTDR